MSKAKTAVVGYVVVSHFRDINDFSKAYEPGQEFANPSEERIQTLLDLGLIEEVIDEKAAAEAAKKAEEEEKAKAATSQETGK